MVAYAKHYPILALDHAESTKKGAVKPDVSMQNRP